MLKSANWKQWILTSEENSLNRFAWFVSGGAVSTWIVCRDSWLPLWFPSRIPASSTLPVKTAFLGWSWIPGGMSCFGDHLLASINLGISVSWTLNKKGWKSSPSRPNPDFIFFISFYMCSTPGSPLWLFTECMSRNGWAFFFNCSGGWNLWHTEEQ